MSELPPQEVLEAGHQFPCQFTFKAIGRNEDEFAARVVAEIREMLVLDFDPPHELKHTAGGRHVAVTVEPHVESSEQALAIFARLRDLPGLVMLM